MISTDDGLFVFKLLFFGFKFETDAGINAISVNGLDFQNAFRASRFEGSNLGRFRSSILQQSFCPMFWGCSGALLWSFSQASDADELSLMISLDPLCRTICFYSKHSSMPLETSQHCKLYIIQKSVILQCVTLHFLCHITIMKYYRTHTKSWPVLWSRYITCYSCYITPFWCYITPPTVLGSHIYPFFWPI